MPITVRWCNFGSGNPGEASTPSVCEARDGTYSDTGPARINGFFHVIRTVDLDGADGDCDGLTNTKGSGVSTASPLTLWYSQQFAPQLTIQINSEEITSKNPTTYNPYITGCGIMPLTLNNQGPFFIAKPSPNQWESKMPFLLRRGMTFSGSGLASKTLRKMHNHYTVY